ncbi:MAG: metalloregulator ArsR/SmtB family transcription factor [Tepidisphaera sp.]|nr:metalloregulator ArsR/SmtB family transcription factor [Tepidisphaera sp.]
MMTQVYTRMAATPKRAARSKRPLDRMLDVSLFRALGDPTRVRLLACLIKCGRACGVGELAACCSVDLSVVSRHLAMLARAGLIKGEKKGREMRYAPLGGDLAARLRELAAEIDACGAACEPGCCEGACEKK